MITTLQIIFLLMVLAVIVAQFIVLLTNKRDYEILAAQVSGLERALRISKNDLIDSERERQWLNNQVDMIWLDIEAGKTPIHPKFQPSWEYRDDSPMDPRD